VEGEPPDREANLDFDITPDVRRGAYANMLNIWYSPYEFALEWGLKEPPEEVDPDDPTSPLRMPVSVVARILVPTGLMFDVLRTLNEAMTGYEAIFGEIRRPEAR
jgi:hypothetical protein